VPDIHSSALDAIASITLVGYAGFLGGYLGSILLLIVAPHREVDPLFVGEHMSAWWALIAAATILVTSL
jgi:hypothetical protein